MAGIWTKTSIVAGLLIAFAGEVRAEDWSEFVDRDHKPMVVTKAPLQKPAETQPKAAPARPAKVVAAKPAAKPARAKASARRR